MPPVVIRLDDAMANLSELVDRASAGEEMVIAKDCASASDREPREAGKDAW